MTAPREEELESQAENGTENRAEEQAGNDGDEMNAPSEAELESAEATEPEEISPEDALRAERDVFEAIDGHRTLGQIIGQIGGDASFFERLWWHDLIVIDASSST